jgi:hypothetical protein
VTVTITTQAPAPGEKVSAALFGDAVVTDLINLANALAFTTPIYAYKTGDESVTSSTTPQDDDHLFVPVVSGAVYEISADLWITGRGTSVQSDFKAQFTFPTPATFIWGGAGLNSGLNVGVSTAGAGNFGGFTTTSSPTSTLAFGTPDTNLALVQVKATLDTTAGGSGTVRLQWAQVNSSVTATTLKKLSRLRAQRMI